MSLSELSHAARVPMPELTAIAQGRPTQVSTAALARIARQLDLPPTALWSNDSSADVELSLHFRHASVPDFFRADEDVARNAVLTARSLDELDTLLEKPRLRTWFSPRTVGSTPYQDGYARAREIRRVLVGKEFLSSEAAPLPDNFDVFVEDLFGIPVVDESLKTASVLALTAKDAPTKMVAIVVNATAVWSNTLLRRRVDVSHELAHALFDQPTHPMSVWVDREEETQAFGLDRGGPIEQRARAFAAELLVPRSGLRELLGPPPAEHAAIEPAVEMVRRTQERFLSSTELTAHHLANNGYFPKYLHDDVVRAVSPSSLLAPKNEPVLVRRAHEARDAGRLTAMAAREVLGLSVWAKLPWSEKSNG